MDGVSLPFIKVAHPFTKLGDPSSINVRGTSRHGSRVASRSSVGSNIEKFTGNQLRPATAGDVPFQVMKRSPRESQRSPRSEADKFNVILSADRSKPILPIFGNQADLGSRCSSRPATSSSSLGSGRIPLEEIERVLQEKMKTGYYSLKNSFISYDPEGRGNVKRESLIKILCNFLAMPLSLSQFNKLMMRMGFEDKKIISIEEFYAKFRPVKSTGEYPTWLDFRHRDPEKMSASQVHLNLKEKVKQRILDLSSVLPKAKSEGTGRIMKHEFRNALNQLGLKMDDKEYEKLWSKYDTESTGVIPSDKLLNKLGVTMDIASAERSGKRSRSSPSNGSSMSDSCDLDVIKEDVDVDKFLMKKLRIGARDLYHAFLEVDERKTGHVDKNQFKKVFRDYDIDVTDEQIKELLSRCGLQLNDRIDYSEFLRCYQSRSESGMINQILADPEHSYNLSNAASQKNVATVSNIEGKLLDFFQKDFMVLLASFKQFDKSNCMTVTAKEFCTVLKTNFGLDIEELDLRRLIPDLPMDEDGQVRYMEFIARFDSRERKSLFDTRSVLQNPPNFHPQATTVGSSRIGSNHLKESRPSSYDSTDGRSVEELTNLIKQTVKDNYQAVQEEFYNIDEYNTKKLRPNMLQSLLAKFGLVLSSNEIKRVWDTFITSQDGSLEFNQFVRHFVFSLKSAAFPNAKLSPPKRGDSDFKVRSKKLNSDFHMLEDALKLKIMLHFEKLRSQFRKLDSNDTGFIPTVDFKTILHDLCIQMTDDECNQLCKKFDTKRNGSISWKEFLNPFAARQQIYRQGNNMSDILNHGNENESVLKRASIPKGLPSITEKLRERLSGDWRTLRRAFRKLDQSNEGYLTTEEFKSVLKLCSVFLDEEELFQLSSELDDSLQGRIPYREFLNRAMTSMSTMTWSSTSS